MTNIKISIFAHAIILSSLVAHAQPSPSNPSRMRATARPWAKNVSEHEQSVALIIYKSGNQEFVNSRFSQALAKYREAIRHWDHPAIRFNMAVCLINLDRPVEAKEHLERSLSYGVAALGAKTHEQALTYQKLLDGQLVHLKIDCPEPDARITLDGKSLFIGPGTMEQVVLPGEHQVVATKDGFVTSSETFVLVAGRSKTSEIRPLALFNAEPQTPCVADTTRTSRPKAPSVPSLPDLSQASTPADSTTTFTPPRVLPLTISVPQNGGSSYSLTRTPSVPDAPVYRAPAQGMDNINTPPVNNSKAYNNILLIRPALTEAGYPLNSTNQPVLTGGATASLETTRIANYAINTSPTMRFILDPSFDSTANYIHSSESSSSISGISSYMRPETYQALTPAEAIRYGLPISSSPRPGLSAYTPEITSMTFGHHSTLSSLNADAPMMSNPMMSNPMMSNPMMSNPMMSGPMMSGPMMSGPMTFAPTNPIMYAPTISIPRN